MKKKKKRCIVFVRPMQPLVSVVSRPDFDKGTIGETSGRQWEEAKECNIKMLSRKKDKKKDGPFHWSSQQIVEKGGRLSGFHLRSPSLSFLFYSHFHPVAAAGQLFPAAYFTPPVFSLSLSLLRLFSFFKIIFFCGAFFLSK